MRVAVRSGTPLQPVDTNSFEIYVGDDNSNGGKNNYLCTAPTNVPSDQMMEIICLSGTQGRYISVHLKKLAALVLYEVEVYGVLLPEP